jgi:hypothetical protein
MADPAPAAFEIRQDPTSKILPLVLGAIALIGGAAALEIPNVVGRIVVWALVAAVIWHFYSTAGRRMVVGDETVDIEFFRRTARIPYSRLDYVVVNAVRSTLHVTFVTNHPRETIRAAIGLTHRDVLELAPRLIRALTIRGVPVRVPGRPDISTG